MFKFRSALPFALMLSLASPLAAQDTEKSKEGDSGLAMGQAVEEGPKPYFREESGDWKLECLKGAQDPEPCQLFQAATDEEGRQLANMRLFRLPEGGQAEAGAVIAVPLEVLLTAQMSLTVDDGTTKHYPYSVCDPLGCYARIGFTTDEIASFKRGSKIVIEVVPFVAPKERMIITMSLKGFTAGYDKIAPVAMPKQ